MNFSRHLTTILCLIWAAPRALAADFLFPGIQSKAAAGAGQTISRGGTALFFNPANLVLAQGLLPEVDLSLASISYSYQNADTKAYDPAVLATTTPLATFGLSYRANERVVFGLALFPLGIGTEQVDHGVPIELIPGTVQAMDLTQTQTAFRAAAGGAWQMTRHVAAGFGLAYYSETTSINLTPAGSDRTTLKADYRGASPQVVLGVRGDFNQMWTFGLTYKHAVTRKYQGSLAVNSASSNAPAKFESQDFKGVGYDPATIGLGVEGRFGRFGPFAEWVHEMWSGGRSIYKQGLGTDSETADLIDVNAFRAGSKLWLSPGHMLVAAIGMASGNMGQGDLEVKGGDKPPVGGIKVGQLAAIPFTVVSGGYRYALSSSGYVHVSALYLNGTKTIPEGYSQAGTFQLTEMLGGIGAAYTF